jgi:2-polyprenyl-6-hydroxyphenyl methylase / 3-demethylubiquinone-9 3-methyltransferase
VPVDNTIYDRPGDPWWSDDGPLSAIRTALNPGRMEYFGRVFADLSIDPGDQTLLDIGCGGGLLAEELARLGCRVTGVDPSEASLTVAREHAESEGLEVEYLRGTGEALPLPDASFDIACCCDVLEHVHDLERVISETSRVLRPGGLYLYDTINRTLASRLVLIKLFQEWSWTSFMPPNLHDWHQFIRPSELVGIMGRHGLRSLGYTGLKPRADPLTLVHIVRQHKRGQLTQTELGERAVMKSSRDTSILYIGHAIKDAETEILPC